MEEPKVFGAKPDDFCNESDVEQKLINPLLVAHDPEGLSLSPSEYKTKPNIKKLAIGKGNGKKLYHPDYVILLRGWPLVVIEAKAPGEDIGVAVQEARRYASEINAEYAPSINPCKYVIACNGDELRLCTFDSAEVLVSVVFADMNSTSVSFQRFREMVSKKALDKFVTELQRINARPRKYHKPTHMIGGIAVRQESVGTNAVGDFFSFNFRNIFNPESEDERKRVATKAYIKSSSRAEYTKPLTEILRAALPPSVTGTVEIGPAPAEILQRLGNLNHRSQELILLVGPVGCGKSTFVDYLIHDGLPTEVSEKTEWIRLNLNDAPLSKDVLYDWVLTEVDRSFRQRFEDFDFDELSSVLKVFSVEYNSHKKTYAKLLGENSPEYKTRLADSITQWRTDKNILVNALIRSFCAEKGKALVLVLDNCDKRNRDDQLVMFDVANWLRSKFRCTVFMPIRDVTYDCHKNEPPLDTAIKDLSFRIDAPSLSEVLCQRVKLVLDAMGSRDQLQYELSNGIKVKVPRDERAFFLWSLIKSVFDSSHLVKELVQGLSGSNIRRGIELFLDICKSKHIPNDELLKIRQSEGNYSIPKFVLFWVLMLGTRKYYSDSSSIVTNLFVSNVEDSLADPFVRLDILLWLRAQKGKKGPNDVVGFHKLSSMLSDLVAWGHDRDRVMSEIQTLYSRMCILSETQSEKIDSEDQLISISGSGLTHLKFLDELVYLACCSQDVWFDQQASAQTISEIITGQRGDAKDVSRVVECADTLLNFLEGYQRLCIHASSTKIFDFMVERPDALNKMRQSLIEVKKKNKIIDPVEVIKRYPVGRKFSGIVVNVQPYGIFVQLEESVVGFIHSSHFVAGAEFKSGSEVIVEVVEFSEQHERFTLKFPIT